jgi:glycosyltransferase involved in cell wall biosynthesis
LSYLRSTSPDAVLVHNDLVAPAFIRRALPKSRIGVILHNEQRTRQKNPASMIHATDSFIPVSNYIADWTIRTHNIPREKVFTNHNGVDLDSFTPDNRTESDTLRVLFLGRIDPNKGPDIAADAVAKLRAEGINVSLSWAGPVWWHDDNSNADPYFRDLKSKMDAAGAKYLGHLDRSHVPDAFRNHDIACVLSRSQEPFGLVVLEAMACGCAVLASNRGGIPEAAGDAAVLVDPDNFDSVLNELRTLATDKSKLQDLKRKSLARAFRASWSLNAKRLEKILTS